MFHACPTKVTGPVNAGESNLISAFWLRLSVVSVLLSLIAELASIGCDSDRIINPSGGPSNPIPGLAPVVGPHDVGHRTTTALVVHPCNQQQDNQCNPRHCCSCSWGIMCHVLAQAGMQVFCQVIVQHATVGASVCVQFMCRLVGMICPEDLPC